jgi:hypothetical protein
MGGSIFSRAKSFLQSGKLQNYINKAKSILASDTYKTISGHAKNFARSVGPTGKAIADTADSLGLGVVNSEANYIGSGYSMSGGKKVTKAQLKKMLMN